MSYLAFGYVFGHARGGMNDLKGVFDSLELAREAIEQAAATGSLAQCEYHGQIVEVDDNIAETVSQYVAYSSHDRQIDTQKWTDSE